MRLKFDNFSSRKVPFHLTRPTRQLPLHFEHEMSKFRKTRAVIRSLKQEIAKAFLALFILLMLRQLCQAGETSNHVLLAPEVARLVLGTNSQPFTFANDSSTTAAVFVFLSTDCPIANGYSPELSRIQATFASRGVRFWSVYCESSETDDSIQRHQKEYQLTLTPLRDPHQSMASALGVTKTPEVVVLRPNGTRVYRGRIDDRHLRLGQSRPVPTTHDLRDALEALLGG